MLRKEDQPQSPDILPTGPSLDVIRELKSQRFIRDGSPFWWSTDYAPDPRELISFDQFKNRLIHLGVVKVKNTVFSSNGKPYNRDVYLYPNPQVSMALLTLNCRGQDLPFLVTARPYHEKEIFFDPPTLFIDDHPLSELPQFSKSGGVINIPNHFYPHVRGLFAGKRGNNFFWYPLRPYPEGSDSLVDGIGFKDVRQSLEEKKLSFLDVFDYGVDFYSYRGVFDELQKHGDLVELKNAGSLRDLDFSYKETSAEEFIEGYQQDKDLLVYYPSRTDAFEHTLPLVITNKTHSTSDVRRPAILGIFADNESVGYSRHRGIARIRDRSFAHLLAQSISQDLGIPVDAVLFTPQKGRPKYERVAA